MWSGSRQVGSVIMCFVSGQKLRDAGFDVPLRYGNVGLWESRWCYSGRDCITLRLVYRRCKKCGNNGKICFGGRNTTRLFVHSAFRLARRICGFYSRIWPRVEIGEQSESCSAFWGSGVQWQRMYSILKNSYWSWNMGIWCVHLLLLEHTLVIVCETRCLHIFSSYSTVHSILSLLSSSCSASMC